jgi:hypothetical protein
MGIMPKDKHLGGEISAPAGDLAAQYAIGVNNAVKGLTDLLGPANPLSAVLEENVEWYRNLLSATALRDEAEVARILADAEDRGVLDQLSAGARAFGASPGSILAGGLGSLTTFVAGGAAAKAARLGVGGVAAAQSAMGAGMQAGIVKNEIYREVRNEMVGRGVGEDEAERVARTAQSYGGKNLDQILIAAGLGGVDGLTGAQRIIGRALLRGGLPAGTSRVASVLGNGLAESSVEAAQGGQEKFASNVVLGREGAETPAMRGVVSSATMEGLAGGVIGGAAASVEPQISPTDEMPSSVKPTSLRGQEDPILPMASMGERGYLPTVEAIALAKGKISQEGFRDLASAVMRDPSRRMISIEGENAELQRSYAVETAARQILEEDRLKNGPITPAPTPASPVEKSPASPSISPEKARVLGVAGRPLETYLAANYPEISKKARNPEEFSAAVKSWRTRIEGEIESGKHLNRKAGTAEFVRQYGYEPSPSQYAEILDAHRARQSEIQGGWVSYLRDGGYSDPQAALILNTITKETAYREGGQWRFQKLGGSTGRLPPAPDPELAARFSREFDGTSRPSRVLAEIAADISRQGVLESVDKSALSMTKGEISWIKFPSQESNPSGFEENVTQLTNLSRTVEEFGCTKWCTAHGKARDFLATGDFYAGVDSEGRARLGIRLEQGQIREIRGVLHSQAVEPGLAPQLTEFISERSLSGGDQWVRDAQLKGAVAELAKGGSWEDLKKAVGKDGDDEAADFVHSYRGPGGHYDFLIGADNAQAQRLAWEKLSSKPVSPLNMIARAGSFSQARDWVDGSILDTPRPPELGGGIALHPLFADSAGMAGKAPAMLREWGLLTPERQSSQDADLNNIWHIQAGGRGTSLVRSVAGPEKADLVPFLEWGGVHKPSLFAANKDGLTPMHLHFEKQFSPHHIRDLSEGADLDRMRSRAVESYAIHGDGGALLQDDGGGWKYPIIFSVAKGGMLSAAMDAGLVSPDAVSSVTDGDGDTPWHKTSLDDIRRMVSSSRMGLEQLALPGYGGVSVAEAICRRPGGFTLLREAGLITPSSALGLRIAEPSLAHAAARVGEAEKALESGAFPACELVKPSGDIDNNFLHIWGGAGLRCSSPEELSSLASRAGLSPIDFGRVNKNNENAYRFFAASPGDLLALAKANLATSEGVGAPGGPWDDTPLHKLPPHSHETYHYLAENGLLTRAHMLKENSRGEIPLHSYIRDEFNGGEGVAGVLKMSSLLGLESGDFTHRHGAEGIDALDVVRDLRRKMDGDKRDPLPEFAEAGLVSPSDIFAQRDDQNSTQWLESRTPTQRQLALAAWTRSPFEDAVRRGGPETFDSLIRTGSVTPEVMLRPHGKGSEWANFTEFVLHQASDDPAWETSVASSIEDGFFTRPGLSVEGRNKPGPVSLRLNDLPTTSSLMSALKSGAVLPKDLTVEGPDPRGSLLSGLCKREGGDLHSLISKGFLEPTALSRISIPNQPDDGNPARYLLEKKPEAFTAAARAGLFTQTDAVFGRNGFDGPIEYAARNGALSSLTGPGLLGPELMGNSNRMRASWVLACREGVALEFANGLVAGGATKGQVRDSLVRVEGDDRSVISSISVRGAAKSLASLAGSGFITREDIPPGQCRGLVRDVLTDQPSDLVTLVRSGILSAGDLYSGRHGNPDLVRFAIGMSRNPAQEIALVRGIFDSGILGPSCSPRLARDLCFKPSGSTALREAIELGVIGRSALTSPGEDGKSALDILLGRASVTASRRDDLAHLLEKGLVPEGYEGRVRRGAQGRFSAMNDAIESVTSRLQSLLSAAPPSTAPPLAPAKPGYGAANPRPIAVTK